VGVTPGFEEIDGGNTLRLRQIGVELSAGCEGGIGLARFHSGVRASAEDCTGYDL
jgi:hypothetical protein